MFNVCFRALPFYRCFASCLITVGALGKQDTRRNVYPRCFVHRPNVSEREDSADCQAEERRQRCPSVPEVAHSLVLPPECLQHLLQAAARCAGALVRDALAPGLGEHPWCPSIMDSPVTASLSDEVEQFPPDHYLLTLLFPCTLKKKKKTLGKSSVCDICPSFFLFQHWNKTCWHWHCCLINSTEWFYLSKHTFSNGF